jgi:hypothetical protein
LQIEKNGYGIYKEIKSTVSGGKELENLVVTLPKKPVVNLYFYEVIVQNWSDTNQYAIPYGEIKPIENKMVKIDFSPANNDEVYQPIITDKISTTMTQIPADDYIVGGSITDSESTKLYGSFGTTYTLTESAQNMYIYFPVMYGFENIQSETERIMTTLTLSSVLNSCGIGPILDKPFEQKEMCVIKAD